MEGSTLAQHPLGALFRTSVDAVCGVMRGAVVFCNGAARELFGRDVTGEGAERLFPGLDLRGEEDFTAAMTVAGKAATVTGAFFRGVRVLTVRLPASPAPLPEGALRQMRLSAAQLRLAMDRLVDPESEDPGTAALYHSYYSLLHSVQQLSDVNALHSGDMLCRRERIDLGALCEELVSSVAYFVRESGVSLRCETPEQSCIVTGDRERLEQLLLILLSNSLHAAKEGGQVTVSLRCAGKQAYLTVADDAAGMDEASLRAAFTVRHDRSGLDAGSGAGMGLAIAEGIARLHGGVLLLRSEEGKGTCASLRLPMSDALPIADADRVSRGPGRILTELADLLPSEAYTAKNRD